MRMKQCLEGHTQQSVITMKNWNKGNTCKRNRGKEVQQLANMYQDITSAYCVAFWTHWKHAVSIILLVDSSLFSYADPFWKLPGRIQGICALLKLLSLEGLNVSFRIKRGRRPTYQADHAGQVQRSNPARAQLKWSNWRGRQTESPGMPFNWCHCEQIQR